MKFIKCKDKDEVIQLYLYRYVSPKEYSKMSAEEKEKLKKKILKDYIKYMIKDNLIVAGQTALVSGAIAATGYGIHKGINHIYKKGYEYAKNHPWDTPHGFVHDMIDDEYNYRYYKKNEGTKGITVIYIS